MRGVDSGFVDHGAIPMEDWDRALGQTQYEAWQSIKSNPNIVVIDSSFALVDPNTGDEYSWSEAIQFDENVSLIYQKHLQKAISNS